MYYSSHGINETEVSSWHPL